MQTAPVNPLVAEKDHEDQNRKVCQWLDEKGFEVDMDRTHILVKIEGKWERIFAGDWVIFEGPGRPKFLDDHDFLIRYAKVQ